MRTSNCPKCGKQSVVPYTSYETDTFGEYCKNSKCGWFSRVRSQTKRIKDIWVQELNDLIWKMRLPNPHLLRIIRILTQLLDGEGA